MLIDLNGELVPISYVEMTDITEQCERANCHCAYGQEDPPDDAPAEGVHFVVLIGGHWD